MTNEFLRSREITSMTTGLPADFRAFHQLHRKAYIDRAVVYLGNHADAEEAVDAAFEQLLRCWPKVLTMENPAAYAWKVMKNRAVDLARARKRGPALLDNATFETALLRDAVDPIAVLEESLNLYQAIKKLPERQQDVVILLHCRGYSVAETATHLGITEAGVRSTARYARRRLQQLLAKEER
ncbi:MULTISPECIES: sigma-70 family RNA polymerase sigma factor [unclassified Streptomyces]|uniref:RNA polymerase sigma factor n=1 Tax=unclassified Streptomyces TaxID=2593676 RepID=UPI0033FE2B8F